MVTNSSKFSHQHDVHDMPGNLGNTLVLWNVPGNSVVLCPMTFVILICDNWRIICCVIPRKRGPMNPSQSMESLRDYTILRLTTSHDHFEETAGVADAEVRIGSMLDIMFGLPMFSNCLLSLQRTCPTLSNK